MKISGFMVLYNSLVSKYITNGDNDSLWLLCGHYTYYEYTELKCANAIL